MRSTAASRLIELSGSGNVIVSDRPFSPPNSVLCVCTPLISVLVN